MTLLIITFQLDLLRAHVLLAKYLPHSCHNLSSLQGKMSHINRVVNRYRTFCTVPIHDLQAPIQHLK